MLGRAWRPASSRRSSLAAPAAAPAGLLRSTFLTLPRPPHPPPRNPVSFMNWLGSGVAIAGTYLYTLATDKHKEEMAAAKKKAA